MSGRKMAQLVGGPFHGHVVEMGDRKPLVMFHQTSCMDGAEYNYDPKQRAYIYEGTPSTEGAASLLHWFNAFLKEYEDGDTNTERIKGVCLDREHRQEAEGQDEVPAKPKVEVQETLWKEEVNHADGTSTEVG